jgi:hypothetical protein
MIDRYPNKVAIKSQDWLQPMDKWEDYHQGARHGTIDHGDASDVVFPLFHLWVLPSSWEILLRRSPSSLSSLWMASRCEWPSVSFEWWRLHELRVKGPSGARKGGPNRPPEWARPAGFGRLAQGHPSPVRSPLHSRGSSCVYALCPPPFALFWRCHPRFQDGGSPCMKFSLLRFHPRGCSFVALRSLPPLEVISSSSWTRTRLLNCSFELVVNPSFMSMFPT